MTKLSTFKSLGLALGCAALVLSTTSISAENMRVNAGTRNRRVLFSLGLNSTRSMLTALEAGRPELLPCMSGV